MNRRVKTCSLVLCARSPSRLLSAALRAAYHVAALVGRCASFAARTAVHHMMPP